MADLMRLHRLYMARTLRRHVALTAALESRANIAIPHRAVDYQLLNLQLIESSRLGYIRLLFPGLKNDCVVNVDLQGH